METLENCLGGPSDVPSQPWEVPSPRPRTCHRLKPKLPQAFVSRPGRSTQLERIPNCSLTVAPSL